MANLSRVLIAFGLSAGLHAMVLKPEQAPTGISISAPIQVAQDPVFKKLFSPMKLEVVFRSSVVNVTGLKAEIHIDGVRKNLVVDLVGKTIALEGWFGDSTASGIRAGVSEVESLPMLTLLRNPPFEYLQLNDQVIEDRASALAQVNIYNESGLVSSYINTRRFCLQELFSKFYRGWIVRVQKEDWREDYYFFYPRNSTELLALAAIKIRPIPDETEASSLLNRLRTQYGILGGDRFLVNEFSEGQSRGSIWFQNAGEMDSDRALAPEPKGIKKLWITSAWSPYVARIFGMAKESWFDQKRQALGLSSNQAVIDHLLTDLQAQIDRPGELSSAMNTFNKLSYLIGPNDQVRLSALDTQIIKAEQREDQAKAIAQTAEAEAQRLEAERNAKEALETKNLATQKAAAAEPERARKNLCEWYETRDYIQKLVEHENQVTDASGVTNMGKRYDLGQSLVFANQLIKEGRATFKKLLHREFDRARDCK